jgi:pimeloyl-ACP methyl ester carboxylesterase
MDDVALENNFANFDVPAKRTVQMSEENLEIRIQEGDGPTLIYLPGTHGDWTLNSGFRHEIKGHARLVEFIFPRTLEWSLPDHANAIEQKLLENKIERGWILAESFASQIAWAWVAQNSKVFQIEGIILAGGFVRHPIIPSVHLAKFLTLHMPLWLLKMIVWFYTIYARAREWDSSETSEVLKEFVSRRTKEDLQAAAHRLELITQNDLRAIARTATVSVFYLTGLVDPIVPWPLVQPWLKKNCSGYCDWKIIFTSDHHVLGAARKSSEQILNWINHPRNAPEVKNVTLFRA